MDYGQWSDRGSHLTSLPADDRTDTYMAHLRLLHRAGPHRQWAQPRGLRQPTPLTGCHRSRCLDRRATAGRADRLRRHRNPLRSHRDRLSLRHWTAPRTHLTSVRPIRIKICTGTQIGRIGRIFICSPSSECFQPLCVEIVARAAILAECGRTFEPIRRNYRMYHIVYYEKRTLLLTKCLVSSTYHQ